jgi:transmembrane sensor
VEIDLPDEIDNMKTECGGRNYPLKKLSSVLFIAAMITFFAINLFPDYLNFPISDYRTRIGEQKAVTLSDGSVVHLNTDTAINVSFSQNVRNIQLLKGEAEFEVAHDASKPFIVISGGIQTRAIGTRFIVRYDDSEGQVTLLGGKVLVKAGDENYNKSIITLNPGEQAAFNKNHLEPLVHLDTKGIDAWKKGRLQMNFVSLDQAITEINRYRRGTVTLLNRRLAEHKINAVIDIKHIDAWLEALEVTLPVKLYRLGPWVIIRSKT